MLRSLVGSEMCIRDRDNAAKQSKAQKAQAAFQEAQGKLQQVQQQYDNFAAALPNEIARFEEVRKKELLEALIKDAENQKIYHEQLASEWSKQLTQLQAELSTTF
eukprot:TRINITY_DN16335_c0_g1_i2.p2 TRINITY_DN16335_c0_g1~~TRINITY_DN16335_c0_g1_i2.p2  ORF type:complete len:105 (-),score=48.04 TRINITY_DN16335_c0_g1_i2:445-759(-)